jgi:tetratricopeptide (TPR) repeat protein
MEYRKLSQAGLFDRISEHNPKDSPENPPFTLILGSGFSYGIIPTTTQIVNEDLPWWKWCQLRENGGPKPEDFLQGKERDPAFAEMTKQKAREFWQRVHAALPATYPATEKFTLDATSGLPVELTLGQAYRFALSSGCTPGLNTPLAVRRYFGDIIKRAGNRLNPAHLYLASIIAEKDYRRLFGTIFTTNFDPLLQRSLQLVNAPYFVSDRPETMQYPDDDDVADAVHVIHAHGSIYRYLLLNSPNEIEKFAAANQVKLQEYFRKHAVLIIGFSGWDDAITRALSAVDSFSQNLYWCDRSADPDKSNLTPAARAILKKHDNAFYVQIRGADDLMVQLHRHLTRHTLPRNFRQPILSARNQLNQCDLTGVKLSRASDLAASHGITDDIDLGDELQAVLRRLDDSQDLFTGKTTIDSAAMLAAQVSQRFASGTDRYFSGKYSEAIPDFDFVISNPKSIAHTVFTLAVFRRGVCYRQRREEGDLGRAISDNTTIINMSDASIEMRAEALINRGFCYSQRGEEGDFDNAIVDATVVIIGKDISVENRTIALINRGYFYGKRKQQGDMERSIRDSTTVIEMFDQDSSFSMEAFVNRSLAYCHRGEAGDLDRAISDSTRAIDSDHTAPEALAEAYVNRSNAFAKRAQTGDIDRAIADLTAVIKMADIQAATKSEAGALLGKLREPQPKSP